MDFHGMKRQVLQSLSKKHGIPANLTNREMADRLALLLKENEKPVDKDQKCSKNLGEIQCEIDSNSKIVNQKVTKKVRFSPKNETFIFVSSETESGSDHDYNPKRRLRKRNSVSNQESKKQVEFSKNIKKAEVSAKSRRMVGREAEMVFSPLAGNKRGRRRVKNVDVCDKPPPIADVGDKDDRYEDAESRGGSIRRHLRSKEVVNEAGEKAENRDLAILRKSSRLRGSKNKREVKSSDGVVLLDQIHEDNVIALEAVAKPEQILKRSIRIVTKDKGSSSLSEDLGETGIGRRVTRSRRVDEKDSALEREAGNLVVEEESQKVLQLEEPAKGSRRKSAAPKNARVQSEDLGETGIGRRFTRSRKVGEKDSALKSEARNLVTEEESQKVLQLEEPAKGSRRKSFAPKNVRVQDERLACKSTEREQPGKGSRKRSRKIDSERVSEVEPIVGIVTKDEDLLPYGPPRRSKRNIASFNSVANAVGKLRTQDYEGEKKPQREARLDSDANIVTKDEDLVPIGPPRRSRRNIALFNSVAIAVRELRTQDNDGKKPQREAPLDSDANIAKPPRRSGRTASKEVGGTADGVRNDLPTKQRKEQILKEESSVTVHEPVTKKPLRRSTLNVSKSNVPELADLKGRSAEKNKQSKARMEIIEEEGSFRKRSLSHEERPVIDIGRERGGSKNDSVLCHRKKVRERSNKKRKGFKGNSIESSQLGSAKISALNSDEIEVTYTTMNLVDQVSESVELEGVSIFQQTQDSIAKVVDKERENIAEEEGIEHLNLDNNLEGALEYQSCHSFNTRTESDDENLVEDVSPVLVEYPSKINNVVSCAIISPASGFPPACQEDFHDLKTEKSMMGKHLSADNGKDNAQEDDILLELDANENFDPDQEEKIQENHLSELSGSRESERISELFSNEAEEIYVPVPYDRNKEEETLQENHLREHSGSRESERSCEKFSNEAETICVLVPYDRNGIAQADGDATETADVGVEMVADIQFGMIASDDTAVAAPSEPAPQSQDGNQLEALTTIHPEIVGRSDAHYVERENCSNNLIQVPDEIIFGEDMSFSKVGGQVCSNERTAEVGTMKEKESEEALNNGLVPASEEVIYEGSDKELLFGGSILQELDQIDGQVTEEEKQEVSDGCFDNAAQETKAKYVDKTDDEIIDGLVTQEAKGIDADGYLCSSTVVLKYKKATETSVEKSSGHENEKNAIEEVKQWSLPHFTSDKLQEGKECRSPGALNVVMSADCNREATYDMLKELQMDQVKFEGLLPDKVAASELIESSSCADNLMPIGGADEIEDNVGKVDGALNFKDHCLKTEEKDDLDNATEVNLETMGDHLVDEGETDVNDNGNKLNHAHEDIRAVTALTAEADAEEIDGKNVHKNIDDTKWDDENSAEVKHSVDASYDKLETCSSGAVGIVLNFSSLEDKVTMESKSRPCKDNEDFSDSTAEMDVDNNVTCQEFAEEILDDLKSAVKDAPTSENTHEDMILSRCLCASGSETNAEQTKEALGSPAPGEVTVAGADLDEVRVFKNLPVLSLVEPKMDFHFSPSPVGATANLDNRASEFHVESEMFTWEMNVILGDGVEDKGETINQSMEAIGKSEHQEKHVKVEENLTFEYFEQGISEMQFSKCEHHINPAVSDKLISGGCVSSNEQNDVIPVIQENTDCETSMEEQSLYKYPFTSMHEVGTKAAEINYYNPAAVEETEAESIEKPGREEISKDGEEREEHVITNKVTELEEAENGASMLPLDSMGYDTVFSKYEIELSKTNGLALGASDVTMSSDYEDRGTPSEIVATESQGREFKFGSSEKQGEVLPDLDRNASIYSESCLSCDGKTANKEENVGKAVDDPKAQVISFDAETIGNLDGVPEDDVNDHLVETELLEQNDNGPDLTLRNAHESSIYATDEGGDDILNGRIGIENVEDGTKLDERLISPFKLNKGCLSDEKKSSFVKSFSVTPSGRNVPGSSRATFSMQNFSLSCGKEYEFHEYSNCVRNDVEGIEMANEDNGFGHGKVNPTVQGENELGIDKRVEGQNSNEGTNNSADCFAVGNGARSSQQVVPEKLDRYTNVLKLASSMNSNYDLDLNNLFDRNRTNRKRNSKETGEEIGLHNLENMAISFGQSNDFLDFGNNASILKPEMDVECSAVSPVTASRTENKPLEIDAKLALFTSYELNLFSEDRERDEFEEVDARTLTDKLINETNEVNDGREIVLSSEKFVKEQNRDPEQSEVEEVIMLKHTQLGASDEPNLINETNEVSEGREIVGSIVSNSELTEGTEIVESSRKECDDERGMVEELAIGKHKELSASDENICENGSIPKEKGGVPVIKQGLVDCEIQKFESAGLEATEIYGINFAASDEPRVECCSSDSKKPENHVNSAVEAVASENPQKLQPDEDKSPEAKLLESISRSGMSKRKTNKKISIPRTPKNLQKIYDMKENFTTSKSEQVNNVTATKTSVKRRALEDLQNN